METLCLDKRVAPAVAVAVAEWVAAAVAAEADAVDAGAAIVPMTPVRADRPCRAPR